MMCAEALDIIEVVRCALQWLCIGALCVIGAVATVTALFMADEFKRQVERFKGSTKVTKVCLTVFVCGMWYIGATKPAGHSSVNSHGCDANISVVGVYTMATNIVDISTGMTNQHTSVVVEYIGEGIDVNTPVSTRNSDGEDWIELVKINPRIVTGATNSLWFIAGGDITDRRYWWIGDDTPAVVVETIGITITDFIVTSSSVTLMWMCDDEDVTLFEVQRRLASDSRDESKWETVHVTPNTASVFSGFTVDKSWQWRVLGRKE